MKKIIKPKERETIIQSLRSGVVPRVGLQHIQVGRSEELKSFIKDIDTISEGGSTFRVIIGEYGSGKTFFMSLTRSVALEKGLVTINADLSPTKRLYGRDGSVRALISELISNISTRTKPDGNALSMILDRFVSTTRDKAVSEGKDVRVVIRNTLQELHDIPTGYSFANVVAKYWEACENGDEALKELVVKWLKAEYANKNDAFNDLGTREIISDSYFFNTLRLYSVLVKKAGYKGLLVCLDEMVNIYKLVGNSRKVNYEAILSILNNTLQGNVSNFGIIIGGTPEFLTDERRGLYSYEALKSRLAENSFSKQIGLADYNSTVLRLDNLSKEEFFVLLKNLRNVFARSLEEKYLIPDDGLISYMNHCANRIGDSYFRTPRNTIKGFIDLLSLLEQHPDVKWSDIIEKIEIKADIEPTEVENILTFQSKLSTTEEDEFATFKL